MVVQATISKPLPPLVQGIKRKSWLQLLRIIFQENPLDWDLHVDNLLCKANSRSYILLICKYFGYPKEHLTKLFYLLIISLLFMELRFGEPRINVNTLIALTGFLSERLDLVTPTKCM